MTDVVNQTENLETGKSELWITIKDASDLLGISERHTWRILLQNAWQTQKLPNNDRKKTFVLRSDVEKYYAAEKERQRLKQLKPPPSLDTSDISDKLGKIGLFDKPDSTIRQMSDIKNLPALMSDYKSTLIDLHKKQEQLIVKATGWKTNAIWFIVMAVFTGAVMGYLLYDTKRVMSDNKKEMSGRINGLSDENTALSGKINNLSDKNMALSGRINHLSDKVATAQNELLSAKEQLFQKEIWINKLETVISERKLQNLIAKNSKKE